MFAKKFLALFMTSMLMLTACSGATETADDGETTTVKIGVITPLSGDAAVYGTETQRVFNYALALLNEEAAERGYEFELVYEDGKCAGAEATTAFQKLTDVDGVDFVLGGVCSSETLGFAPLLEDKGVLVLNSTSSSPELLGASSNYFSLSYSDTVIGTGIADELQGYERVAILTEQHDFSTALTDVVVDRLESEYPNVEIVFNEEFALSETEFRNQLQKVQESNPDVLVMDVAPGVVASGALVKQIGEIADWDIALLGPLTIANEVTLATGVLEGAIMVDAPKVEDPAFKEMMDAIIAEQGTLDNLGNYYTASTYDALQLMVQLVMEHDGDVDAMRAALENETHEGFLGDIYFDETHYVQGIPAATFVVQGDEWVPAE